jgi:hypothetical protein
MIARTEALDKLASLDIKAPYIYLIDIVALIEMIWADGEVQQSELAILDDYLHKRVEQINNMAYHEVISIQDAQAFVEPLVQQKPPPERLAALRSLIGPIILTSSDSVYVDLLLKSLLEACIDIAANAVKNYPYDIHGRFDPAEKACFFSILKTLIEFRGADKVKNR